MWVICQTLNKICNSVSAFCPAYLFIQSNLHFYYFLFRVAQGFASMNEVTSFPLFYAFKQMGNSDGRCHSTFAGVGCRCHHHCRLLCHRRWLWCFLFASHDTSVFLEAIAFVDISSANFHRVVYAMATSGAAEIQPLTKWRRQTHVYTSRQTTG